MIVSIFLKYFKTYQGINYVPITDEDHFCGLVGENGIGKSSVLEAIDCVLNDKLWNFNTVTKKSGLATTKPHILPVFLVKKDSIKTNTTTAEKISNIALTIEESDVVSAHRPHIRKFLDHRDKLIQRVNVDDYYLLPLGIDHDRKITLFFFECEKLLSEFEPDIEDDSMKTYLTK
jgi:predicted ATP-binding protein involved in virulence